MNRAMRSRLLVTASGMFLAVISACAQSQQATTAGTGSRRIDVEMRESHYSPASVVVDRGSKVMFRFTNRDKIVHDAFIGDEAAQKAHEKEMRAMRKDDGGGHEMGHEDDMAITLQPGKTGELSYDFTKTGETLIGCHEPGHYAAGMVMKVTVR